MYRYAICPDCGQFYSGVEEIVDQCTCGSSLRRRRDLYGTFIIPEFGFVAAPELRKSGESRPQRSYSSRVFFAEYAPPSRNDGAAIIPELTEIPTKLNASVLIWQRYSRFGKLVIVNSGTVGRGFRICQWCGYADQAPEPSMERGSRRRRPPAHRHPRTGRECSGPLVTRHLGHEFLSDVIEFRFEGFVPSGTDQRLWRSLVYSLLEGASEALNIRRDDLDGTLYRHSGLEPPAVILYDNVPGGAGHVRRIAENPVPVFEAAYRRVNNDCCGSETSCYECLRNYRNQLYHEELVRGLARDFLEVLLSEIRQTEWSFRSPI